LEEENCYTPQLRASGRARARGLFCGPNRAQGTQAGLGAEAEPGAWACGGALFPGARPGETKAPRSEIGSWLHRG